MIFCFCQHWHLLLVDLRPTSQRCSGVYTTIFVRRKDKTDYLSNQTWANGVFFSAKKMSPCYKVHYKKLLTSPVIMQFFIWEGQNTNIKKVYACVYHLLRSTARSLLFRRHISSACFYNANFECKFFYITAPVALIMKCFFKVTLQNNEKIKF